MHMHRSHDEYRCGGGVRSMCMGERREGGGGGWRDGWRERRKVGGLQRFESLRWAVKKMKSKSFLAAWKYGVLHPVSACPKNASAWCFHDTLHLSRHYLVDIIWIRASNSHKGQVIDALLGAQDQAHDIPFDGSVNNGFALAKDADEDEIRPGPSLLLMLLPDVALTMPSVDPDYHWDWGSEKLLKVQR